MDFTKLIKIASDLDEAGYSDYSKDLINEAVELQNESVEEKDTEMPYSVTDTMDEVIGAILYDLASHNNIQFLENGQLTSETLRNIVNSFDQVLSNAKMS